MYTNREIETIFNNCSCWDELQEACSCFITVMGFGDLTDNQKVLVGKKSIERYRQIEKL
jgi:hypothetical protein